MMNFIAEISNIRTHKVNENITKIAIRQSRSRIVKYVHPTPKKLQKSHAWFYLFCKKKKMRSLSTTTLW